MNLSKSTLLALRKSIKHWWENWSGAKPYSDKTSDCALCQKFTAEFNPEIHWLDSCINCPVMLKTGYKTCKGTPYYNIMHAEDKENQKAELDFLISIYEEATGTKLIYTEDKPPHKIKTK